MMLTTTHKKILAGLLAFIALWFMAAQLFRPSIAPESNLIGEALGQIAAEEALARFEEGRSWTLLVDHDAGPTLQTAARSLERAARNGGVSNVRVHVLDPAEADEHTGLRPGLIESLAGSDSAGQVLISLGFFPPQNAHPPLPRMVVILPSTDQGADFLAAGTVDMVIEPAFADPESGLTRRDSPRRWFDSYFRIRTGES